MFMPDSDLTMLPMLPLRLEGPFFGLVMPPFSEVRLLL